MGLKILTVDDSKTIRMIVKKAFRPYDCQVVEGENGVEGLALAAKENPDLIVLDITMPVMNGAEMLAKMKENPDLKDIPVIMLTAEAGKDNVMKIVQMGVQDYMVKPFKGEQLIERVTKIVTLAEKKANDPQEEGGESKYFNLDGDIQLLAVPPKILRPTIVEVETQLKSKLKEMTSGGIKKMVLDLSKIKETNVSLIKLVITVLDSCQAAGIKVLTVASAGLGKELKDFQETGNIPIHFSIDDAKSAF
jgi:CheY-like chemotaxis protein